MVTQNDVTNLPATDARSAWYWGPILTCL